MAVTQHSIKIIKEFPFQGDLHQQFTNRYYFDGASPGDSDAWHVLMDAIVLLEKTLFTSRVNIVGAAGYAPGSEVAVASKTYAQPGTATTFGSLLVPGECCNVVRWATTKKSTKNHTVYCFSYYHGVLLNSSAEPDVVNNNQWTAINNYAQDWVTGISVAGRNYKRCTPDGHLVTGRAILDWISHRDFVK